jgi:uncharacterized C2H2 Zn-finger protein
MARLNATAPVTVDNDGELECPVCSSTFMHQMAAETYFRNTEDSLSGVLTVSAARAAVADNDASLESNPSPRRDGIRILFKCENCHPVVGSHSMTVVQHKGHTIIGWEQRDSAGD